MKYTILFLVLFIIADSPLIACSCAEREIDLPISELGLLSTESEKTKSIDDYIFHGELIFQNKVKLEIIKNLSEKNESLMTELFFKVIEPIKGENIQKGDTILVYTQSSSDACGFMTPINTKSIIFAASVGLGKYFTYRGDCCKSVSEALDKKRYDNYLEFINVVTTMVNGKYEFNQPKSYWDNGRVNETYSEPQLTFEINNGQFNGEWKLMTRSGFIIEQGKYKAGKKIGIWELKNIKTNYYEFTSIINTKIKYENGIQKHRQIEEIKRTYNFNEVSNYTDKVIRIETTEIEIKQE